jgi:hypothetical protein
MDGTPDLALTSDLSGTCRARWPQARFRQTGGTLSWVDGPARADVLGALDAAGHTRVELDEAGIRLARHYSRQVIATVVLVALDMAREAACEELAPPEHPLAAGEGARVERWCLRELDELRRYAIRPGAPPPLGPVPASPARPDEHWARAGRLVEALGTKRPVAVDQTAGLRRVLRRLGALALVTDIEHVDHVGIRTTRGPGPDPARYDPSQTLFLDVPLAAWPDTGFTAIVASDQQLQASPPMPRLRWTDGPSPAQLEVSFAAGLPDPLAGCDGYEVDRQLSATGITASVLLHRTLHATPYRDRGSAYHFMARWKSAVVRELDRRDQPSRDRLARIQQHLLELPLPLTGPLPPPLAAGGWSEGDRLWAAAEILLALTRDRVPALERDDELRRLPAADRIAVELSSTLEDTGTGALALLIPNPPTRPGHRATRR